jgi:hypothetical protein
VGVCCSTRCKRLTTRAPVQSRELSHGESNKFVPGAFFRSSVNGTSVVSSTTGIRHGVIHPRASFEVSPFYEAFIWTESEGIRSIREELAKHGLEIPADLEIRTAEFISDSGKTIVGRTYSDPSAFWRVIQGAHLRGALSWSNGCAVNSHTPKQARMAVLSTRACVYVTATRSF